MENKNFNKKVYIETMGCQMNKSDTERILGMLSHFGYEETQEPKEADLLMVNTCSIRQLSADKAYSLVGVWGKWKDEERKKEQQGKPFREIKVAFCGCVAQQDKEKLLKRFPYVDLVFGTNNVYELPDLIKELTKVKESAQQTKLRKNSQTVKKKQNMKSNVQKALMHGFRLWKAATIFVPIA